MEKNYVILFIPQLPTAPLNSEMLAEHETSSFDFFLHLLI